MRLQFLLYALLFVATAAGFAAVYALSKLNAALSEVRRGDEALAARLSELQTLHAIAREITASADPERITAIVERECRKIFEVDTFFLGLVDRAASDLAAAEVPAPLKHAPVLGALRDKRAVRIDDGAEGSGTGSLLAAPLLAGERAVGVLCLHSARPSAYDDHHLSVLATIAQQAASAVERANGAAAATTDALTGLFLRDAFVDRLEAEYLRARRYGSKFSILMLDLDRFREVDQKQGRAAGDRYLRELGAAIQGRMRAADIGGRFGDDELCLLLPETELDGAGRLAERLRQTVARLVVDADGAPVRTTVSIGISAFPAHDTGAMKGLLLRADQALARAKRDGGNRVVPFAV